MNLLDQLRRDEGVKYEPYVDSRGFVTIGAGTKLPITDGEVNALLELRLTIVTTELTSSLPWLVAQVDEVRRNALRNMAYNLGVPRLLEFKKMLHAMQTGNWTQAAVEALDSDWSRQVGARAIRLAKQIKTGVMQ